MYKFMYIQTITLLTNFCPKKKKLSFKKIPNSVRIWEAAAGSEANHLQIFNLYVFTYT